MQRNEPTVSEKKERRRRYYLHRMAKKSVSLAVKPKTIFLPIAEVDDKINNKYILELRDRFGYVIQMTIV